MHPGAKPCPYCGTLIARSKGLCSVCVLALTKYPDQNAVIIAAYVAAGIREFEQLLANHAAFAVWLTAHGQPA